LAHESFDKLLKNSFSQWCSLQRAFSIPAQILSIDADYLIDLHSSSNQGLTTYITSREKRQGIYSVSQANTHASSRFLESTLGVNRLAIASCNWYTYHLAILAHHPVVFTLCDQIDCHPKSSRNRSSGEGVPSICPKTVTRVSAPLRVQIHPKY